MIILLFRILLNLSSTYIKLLYKSVVLRNFFWLLIELDKKVNYCSCLTTSDLSSLLTWRKFAYVYFSRNNKVSESLCCIFVCHLNPPVHIKWIGIYSCLTYLYCYFYKYMLSLISFYISLPLHLFLVQFTLRVYKTTEPYKS